MEPPDIEKVASAIERPIVGDTVSMIASPEIQSAENSRKSWDKRVEIHSFLVKYFGSAYYTTQVTKKNGFDSPSTNNPKHC